MTFSFLKLLLWSLYVIFVCLCTRACCVCFLCFFLLLVCLFCMFVCVCTCTVSVRACVASWQSFEMTTAKTVRVTQLCRHNTDTFQPALVPYTQLCTVKKCANGTTTECRHSDVSNVQCRCAVDETTATAGNNVSVTSQAVNCSNTVPLTSRDDNWCLMKQQQ